MKKKVVNRVVLTLAMVAALCSMTGSAFAVGTNVPTVSAEMISPRYATIRSLSASLTISSSGRASCRVEVSLYGSYTGEISMYLQDRSSGWQTVKSWSSNGGACDGSYYVPDEDTYRVMGVLRVYNSTGKLVETATTYSNEISF